MSNSNSPVSTTGAISAQSAKTSTSEVLADSPASAPTNTALPETLVHHGSPIVILLLLIWLFRALATFVKVCKED